MVTKIMPDSNAEAYQKSVRSMARHAGVGRVFVVFTRVVKRRGHAGSVALLCATAESNIDAPCD